MCASPITAVHHRDVAPPAPAAPPEPVASRAAYRPGDAIVHAGDPAVAVQRVERGLVALVAPTAEGRDRIVGVLGPGDVIGAAEGMAGRRHGVDAVALTGAVLVATPRDAFRRRVVADPELACDLIDTLGTRLVAAWEDLTTSYLPVETRLARALVLLAARFAEPAPGGRRLLRCGLSHQALAALIGAQRPSVSAAMAALRAGGAAVGSRGRYLIDPAALASFAPADALGGFDPPAPARANGHDRGPGFAA